MLLYKNKCKLFRRILFFGIIMILICNVCITGIYADTDNSYTQDNNESTAISEVKEIRIALYSMDIYAPMDKYFVAILNGYQWTVGNVSYKFTIYKITDKEIFQFKLTPKNYDLLIIPAMEADSLHVKRFLPTIRNIIWEKNIARFIKNGGGYLGYCAAAMLAGDSGLSPMPIQRIMNVNLGITDIKIISQNGIPFISQLFNHPENIGPNAYNYFSGWDVTNKSHSISGVPLDFTVNRDNPIFDDLHEETRRIRWVGGGELLVPNQPKPDNNITILAYYPEEEISDNVSTQIHAWKYTGGLIGFLKGFIRARKHGGTISQKTYLTPFMATDWKQTDKIIQTNLSNKPFMTMETYPNNKKGRIILCIGHPEMSVFWGGHIEEKTDTNKNCLFDALHYWKDYIPFNETLQDEDKYNWWMVRRQAAWVSKVVPDNDLPPIYGPSQVSDIYPYKQPLSFIIIGNVEPSDGIVSLELYYRYSNDNVSWDNWTYYDTCKNKYFWDFNAPYGPGFYQFFSLRKVEFEYNQEIESFPPGPDAIAQLN
jgi:hypothetical protein